MAWCSPRVPRFRHLAVARPPILRMPAKVRPRTLLVLPQGLKLAIRSSIFSSLRVRVQSWVVLCFLQQLPGF
eukprot:6207440-Pleurochrysis_carterae.AAC.2